MINFDNGHNAENAEDDYIIDELIRKDPNYETTSLSKIEALIS